jgi:ribonuclease E
MKEALKNDRARIQVGRISSFGLMEMSRQRLRTGVLEASTRPCPHCEGSGLMRTAASAALSALRMLEEEAARGRGSRIVLRAGREAAVYLLNRKRGEIAEVEHRYGAIIEVLIDEALEGAKMSVESLGPPPVYRPKAEQLPAPAVDEDEDLLPDEEDEEDEEPEAEDEEERAEAAPQRGRSEESQDGDRGRKRRRRRGRRGGRRRERPDGQPWPEGGEAAEVSESEATGGEEVEELPAAAAPEVGEEPVAEEVPAKPKRGSRGRRVADAEVSPDVLEAAPEAVEPPEAAPADEAPEAKPARGRRRKAEAAAEPAGEESKSGNGEMPAKGGPRRRTTKTEPVAPEAPMLERQEGASAPAGDAEIDTIDVSTARRGWWQRTFGG